MLPGTEEGLHVSVACQLDPCFLAARRRWSELALWVIFGADALAAKYPLAATLLLRAMIDFTLKEGRASPHRRPDGSFPGGRSANSGTLTGSARRC